MKFINKEDVFSNTPQVTFATPGIEERGFQSYPAIPCFHLSKRFGRNPPDIEEHGPYWRISDRTKILFEEKFPNDFVFLEIKTEVDAGEAPVKYWLCDIISVKDPIDVEKSDLRVAINALGGSYVVAGSMRNAYVSEDLVGNSNIFRLIRTSGTIICDDIFVEMMKKNQLIGLRFKDLTPR